MKLWAEATMFSKIEGAFPENFAFFLENYYITRMGGYHQIFRNLFFFDSISGSVFSFRICFSEDV